MSPPRSTGTDTDVVVVGGRIAGAAVATHLARAGVRVVVLDRARFPSDTASTHIVQPRGTAALERLGVLGALREAGASAIEGIVVQYADARLEASYAAGGALLSTGTTPGLSLRRVAMDATLLAAAGDAGAEVHTTTGVDGLLRDGAGRVCGVRTGDGAVRARLVIGADGRRSSVARLAGSREYDVYRAPRLAAWTYLEGAAPDGHRLRIGRFGHTALLATPAGNGLLLVGVVPPARERERFLAERDTAFDAGVARWPELADVTAGARRVGPMRVVPDWRAYFRQAAGPGWVLTGDAGNFKDPSAAQGITDALRQAETLAARVASALAGPDAGLDAGTRRWGAWRDRDARAMHWFARDLGAGGGTTPVLTETVRAVAAEEPLLLAAVLNRDLPPSAVLTPGRIARAAATALVRHPAAGAGLAREAVSTARARVQRASWVLRRPRS